MGNKKIKHIGKKVGNLAAWLQGISIVIMVILCIVMFSSLTTNILQTQCVDGTNLLVYELQNYGSQRDVSQIMSDLKTQMGCEFIVFEGDRGVYSTIPNSVGVAIPEKAAQAIRQGQNFLGKVQLQGEEYLCSLDRKSVV